MIFIDFDGVVADLLTEWLCRFNRRFPSYAIKQDGVTSWEMSEVVPEHLSDEFFAILHEPDLYRHVEPVEGAVAALRLFDGLGIDWTIATSCTSASMIEQKAAWMDRFGLAKYKNDHHKLPTNLIAVQDKGLLAERSPVPTRDWQHNILIDDALHNLSAFQGYRVLFDQPYNQAASFYDRRVFNWSGVLNLVLRRHYAAQGAA